MNAAFTALLLIYGTLWPSVTGYMMQEISLCKSNDDKRGNITFTFVFIFNRQLFLYYNEEKKQFFGCSNCIEPMPDIGNYIAQQMNADPNWMSHVRREGERCKEEVRTFWDKTVERKVKPSVELFQPVQVHAGSLPVLVCHVSGFYPQDINVALFKNDVLVKNYTEAVRNGDWTYHVTATLDLRNYLHEDNYTCLVTHPSLDMPIVMKWNHGFTNVQIIKLSVASVVFVLGLVCLISGVVLWKNVKRSGYSPIPGENEAN